MIEVRSSEEKNFPGAVMTKSAQEYIYFQSPWLLQDTIANQPRENLSE